ncbi:hypothetical protein P3S67_023246 [Capsicum chacoense]
MLHLQWTISTMVCCDLKPSNVILDHVKVSHFSDFVIGKIIRCWGDLCSNKDNSNHWIYSSRVWPRRN